MVTAPQAAPCPSRSGYAPAPEKSKLAGSSQKNDRRKLLKVAVQRRSIVSAPQVHCPPPTAVGGNPVPLTAPLTPCSPSTVIIGDSIVRRVKFANAIVHCFPGITTAKLLEKVPSILDSLPPSISRIVIHTGANDQYSEIARRSFIRLFDLLRSSGKSIFISGPLPTMPYHGNVRLSRLQSLHYWLQSTCHSHSNNITYISNFFLFWDRSSYYMSDGLHPSIVGAQMLSYNIKRSVAVLSRPHY